MKAADLIYKFQKLSDGENDEVVIIDNQIGLIYIPIADIYRREGGIVVEAIDVGIYIKREHVGKI